MDSTSLASNFIHNDSLTASPTVFFQGHVKTRHLFSSRRQTINLPIHERRDGHAAPLLASNEEIFNKTADNPITIKVFLYQRSPKTLYPTILSQPSCQRLEPKQKWHGSLSTSSSSSSKRSITHTISGFLDQIPCILSGHTVKEVPLIPC